MEVTDVVVGKENSDSGGRHFGKRNVCDVVFPQSNASQFKVQVENKLQRQQADTCKARGSRTAFSQPMEITQFM
jgi:hypothetical protein